ncbi:hypothetical protein [Pararhodobacter oceanensis]|uniref:hypothetical protein n=1 Tax=Pararhodobacter oceanensis TaxID=2172121 RepID=UPI003A916436
MAPHVIPLRDALADLHRSPHPQPPNRLRDRRIRFHQHNLAKTTDNNTFTIDTRPRDIRNCPDRPSHALIPRTDRRIERTNATFAPSYLRADEAPHHGNMPL